MSTSYDQAPVEMFTLFNIAWQAQTAAIVGTATPYVPEVRVQGKAYAAEPVSNKFWCRFATQSVLEEQATLQTSVTQPNCRRYRDHGIVAIELFCPMSVTNSYAIGRKLAIAARNALRGKTTSGAIWFRNVRIQNIDPENLWYRFNIIAEYEYDDIG